MKDKSRRGQSHSKKVKLRETKARRQLTQWFSDNRRLGQGDLNRTWGLKRPKEV